MTVAQIGQRFCRNIAAMAGLAIDNQMVLQLGPDVPMPSLNFPEVNVQIGSGNESCRMFFRRSDIDQDETLRGIEDALVNPARNCWTVSK